VAPIKLTMTGDRIMETEYNAHSHLLADFHKSSLSLPLFSVKYNTSAILCSQILSSDLSHI
jgi:hypothetical protein